MNRIEEIQDIAYNEGRSDGWNEGIATERDAWNGYLDRLLKKYEGNHEEFFQTLRKEVNDYFLVMENIG